MPDDNKWLVELAEAVQEITPDHDIDLDNDSILVSDNVIVISRGQDEPPFTEYM